MAKAQKGDGVAKLREKYVAKVKLRWNLTKQVTQAINTATSAESALEHLDYPRALRDARAALKRLQGVVNDLERAGVNVDAYEPYEKAPANPIHYRGKE